MSKKNCQDWHSRDFYCINCGAKGIPILRAGNKLKEKNHRKRMYCPTCKHETNHIECRNYLEQLEFIEAFNAGEFADEAKESLNHERERSSSVCNVRFAGVW